MAEALAKEITLGVTTDGPLMELALSCRSGGTGPAAAVQLTLRVPARLGIECDWAAASSTSPTWAHCRSSRRRAASGSPDCRRRYRGAGPGRDRNRPCRIGGHRDRSRQVRIADVAGSFEVEARRGDFRARGIGGAAQLEGGTSKPSSRISPGRSASPAPAASPRLRRARPHHGETERTTLKLMPGAASRSGDDRTRRDRADAAAGRDPAGRAGTNGDIRTPDRLIEVQRAGDDATASGPLRGDGPLSCCARRTADITVAELSRSSPLTPAPRRGSSAARPRARAGVRAASRLANVAGEQRGQHLP